MGIASGNTPWQDFPSTATPITAGRLNAIEDALDANKSGKVSKGDLVINVRDYGAVGDGVTDDTAAIQAAADAAATTGGRLFARGHFAIASTVILGCNADLSDATLTYTGTGVAMQVGGASVTTARSLVLPKLTSSAGFGSTATGIDLRNLNACDVRVTSVNGFGVGVQVTGSGTGNVYNNYHLGEVINCTIGLKILATAEGWSNQNLFLGGKFTHNPALGTAVTGCRHVDMETTQYLPDNLTFLGTSFEGDTVEQTVGIKGKSIALINCRWESASPKILWRAGSSQNRVLGGYNAVSIVEQWESEASVTNTVDSTHSRLVTVPTGYRGDTWEHESNASSPVWQIMPPGSRASGAAAGAWTWAGTSAGLRGKQSGDAFPRLFLDASVPGIYFGDGDASPLKSLRRHSTTALRFDGTDVAFLPDDTHDFGLAGNYRPRFVRAVRGVNAGANPSTSRDAAALGGVGTSFFDTTIGKPIWWNGANWVDANGTPA